MKLGESPKQTHINFVIKRAVKITPLFCLRFNLPVKEF
jgi:hypothetical protein